MRNHLKDQSSPYLLQHSEDPVNWYPWCERAFERAAAEDKPIFLSIGYSTCHWCHVMAHECFESEQTADILNRYFICVKVDREERPDIDSIYMAVCQAFTGSGGWPTSIFMTPDKKPFFAGTYFPKKSTNGMIGFDSLINIIKDKWQNDRQSLIQSAEQITAHFNTELAVSGELDQKIINSAVKTYKQTFDGKYGGFGDAPKFPSPHSLIFLITHYQKTGDEDCLHMAEKTLIQMYRGGLFDHIGGGFCRYSTDRYFLVPHFEKMLYDNALLIMAYCRAYSALRNPLLLEIAQKTADWMLREMQSPNGAFFSARDADSDGGEGAFYLFSPDEIDDVLGHDAGEKFSRYYGIMKDGSFGGAGIPNLLQTDNYARARDFSGDCERLYQYRENRHSLYTDDKILTAWNSLAIAAMSDLYRVSRDRKYLDAAISAQRFIEKKLCLKDTLFVSLRGDKKGVHGFIDEYAFYIFALLALYGATFDYEYLKKAERFCEKTISHFYDGTDGGFCFSGRDNEKLIFTPKEVYDGAMPSGNSVMAYNLVRLYLLTRKDKFKNHAERQLKFMAGQAADYPAGFTMFLTALSDYLDPPVQITVVKGENKLEDDLPMRIPLDAAAAVDRGDTDSYRALNGKTTFYICRGHCCLPPSNRLCFDNRSAAHQNKALNSI